MLRELVCRPPAVSAQGVLGLVLLAGSASAQWPQWGGPERDFRSSATGLADAWPESGPKQLWERALGPGYSSIVAAGGRLYTLVLSDGHERIVALDARSGATAWEHELRAVAGNEPPNSTPILAGGKLFALGFAGHLCALDERSGELAWSHDLVAEYKAQSPQFGFAASPLVYGESLIVPVGGKGFGVAAFAQADGRLLWHAQDFVEIYASPLLIEVEGEVQVVVLTAEQVAGLDPASGALLWSEPIENAGGQNIATPVWSAERLYVTSGTRGSVALKLARKDGKTRVERAWSNDRQVAQTTVVRVGEHLYGSTGHDALFVTAMHAGTGAIAWEQDGFSVANLLAVDGKLLLLDYEGVLALATPGPAGLKVHSRASLLTPQAFTPPTLDGRTLYLRDLKSIRALDLGRPD